MSRRKSVIAACIVFLLAVVAWLYWFVTAHGFSAREKPWAVEAFIARHLRRLATAPHVKKLQNPVSPTLLNLAEDRDHFADHCALCHANDGSGQTQINAGLYPPAPDMREEGTQKLYRRRASLHHQERHPVYRACRDGAERERKTGSWSSLSDTCRI